jgi:G3E family GTPase
VKPDEAGSPPLAPSAGPLPVAIVTGFLGSGKTTFIQGLLQVSGGARIAVVVNEFGELGLDGALLQGASDHVIELPGGCMCCESRGDVARALSRLADRAQDLDAIVVESSGVADPLGVAEILATGTFTTDLTLSLVVAVVDAENFDRNLADAETAYRQLTSADLFVVGKSDLVDPAVVTAIRGRLAKLNPHAAVLPSNRGRSATSLLGEVPGIPLVLTQRRDVHEEVGYDSAAWRSDRPVQIERLLEWMENLPPNVSRVKALARSGRTCVTAHRVGSRVTVLPADSAAISGLRNDWARVIVIGRQLDARLIDTQLAMTQQSTEETA